ncbi:hypothetical protein C3L33_06125, partial [Rhododendron williamsianum]
MEPMLEEAMGGELKKWLVVVAVVLFQGIRYGAEAQSQVPCYFIFGDSLVDNGNNNNIASLAKANYMPYGIDFPGAEQLGFNGYIPPYATARGRGILSGVNYASAAAGIRDETGQQLGGRVSFTGQVNNYKTTVSQVVNILGGEDAAANYLSKCIYSVGLGSNDYLNNYFMPSTYSTSRQYTPDQYADVLIQQYAQQIRLFNNRLKSLVDNLNNNFSDAKFIYINAYGIFQDLITNPSSFGFKVTNAGCCGVGRNNGQITCLPLQTPCQNRNEYIFWDAFHPTEAANIILGRRSYSAQSSSDSYPMDIRRLAQL